MKGSILTNLKMYCTIRTKQTYCSYKPIQINIEPTNVCNLHCSFCPQDKLERKRGFMDFDFFKGIIDKNHKFMKNSEIHLYMFGESLLHQRISDMISYLKKYDLLVQLNTNATLIDEEKSKKLIESGLDKLYFSIDSETDKTKESYETFMKVRGSGKCPQVIAGILENTKKDISAYRNADKIYWSPKHNFAGGVNLEDLPNPHQVSLKKYGCYFPFYMMVIDWQGNVGICCKDYNLKLNVGNINKQTLEEIWNNERIQRLRKNFFDKNEPPLCKQCSDLYISKFGIKNLRRQLIK